MACREHERELKSVKQALSNKLRFQPTAELRTKHQVCRVTLQMGRFVGIVFCKNIVLQLPVTGLGYRFLGISFHLKNRLWLNNGLVIL